MKVYYQNPSYDWWVECEFLDGFWYASIMPKNVGVNPEFELTPYKLGVDKLSLTHQDYINVMYRQGLKRVLVIPS